MTLRERIAPLIKGDVTDDAETLKTHSRDTSVFERIPSVVVFPKDADDVAAIVRFVATAKESGEHISITGRSAGTDMSGGPLTDSIVLSFTKYMNHAEAADGYAVAEPGIYYRDFEKITKAHGGQLLPSFPASRELCAIGGIVSNDSGGELTLMYGKTHDYVQSLDVVLADGTKTVFGPLSSAELEAKKQLPTLEGDIYRKIDTLITENLSEITAAQPSVTKNSAGYALWRVRNGGRATFNLAQVIVGSQGTLAMVTKAQLQLVTLKKHRAMTIVFLRDLHILPEIVKRILAQQPESFESYDNNTFSLAVHFLPQMLQQMGLRKAIAFGFAFLPEVWTVLTGGIPKLVLLAEFAADTEDEARELARAARLSLHDLPVQTRLAANETESAKFWKIRREAFALLRKNMKGLTAAPFIDDFVVHPADYPAFLPRLNALLDSYGFIYAITGHIGDGNFHIFPMLDLSNPRAVHIIRELSRKVYELVGEFHGSITGEHNDGIIRTPYLYMMYSPKMLELFAETKKIFDPTGIFNPGKKTGMTEADIEKYVKKA